MNTIVIKDLFSRRRIIAESLLEPAFIALFLSLPMGTSLRTILAAGCLMLWLISGHLHQVKEFLRQSWFWPMLLLFTLPWFGLLYTPDPVGFGLVFAKKTHYWLYGLALAGAIVHFRHQPETIIKAFLIGLAINVAAAIMQLLGILPKYSGWYTGLSHGYATLSAYLILGVLLASFFVRYSASRPQKLLWLALSGLFFFHLIILHGRTGYLTFLFVSPVILKNWFSRISPIKLACVCLLIPGLMMISPIVHKRVSLSIDQLKYHIQADKSVSWGKTYTVHQDRFYMWRGALELYRDNPFFGVGTGGYREMMRIRGKADAPLLAHPHNDFLFMAVHYGFLGIIAYLWLFVELFRNGWRERHTIRGFFIFGAGLIFIFGGLFNAQLLDSGMALLLALTVAMQAGLARFSAITEPSAINRQTALTGPAGGGS